MSVNYDYYRIFYYVGKYRSFTQAAKALHSSQPNVTRAMNNLEHALGCHLFIRTHRGVALTPEGEGLYLHVKAAHEHLQTGEAELSGASPLMGGHLSIGASEIALHGLLLPVLQQFRKTYPKVHIEITNHSTPQAVSAVRSGSVELAVITSPAETSKPLLETPLMEFQDILIGGHGFSQLRGKALSLRDLMEYPLVLLGRETSTYAFFQKVYSQQGLLLTPDIEAATTDQIVPLVQYDLGLGFVPSFFAADAIARGDVFSIPLSTPLPPRRISLVQDKSHPSSAAARAFLTLLKEHIAQASTEKA